MKLITLTVVVNDWRDMDTSDAEIDKLLNEVRARINQTIEDVGEEHDIALSINED